MKLLIFIPHHSLLGPQGHRARLDGLLSLLDRETVHIAVPENAPREDLDGLRCASITPFRQARFCGSPNPLVTDFSRSFLRQARAMIDELEPSAVMFDFPWGLSLLSRFTDTPLIYFSHGVERDFARVTLSHVGADVPPLRWMFTKYVEVLERGACRRSRLVIAMSEHDRARFLSFYGGATEKYLALAQPIFAPDPERRNAAERRSEFGLDPKAAVVVFHGSWSHLPNRLAMEFIRDEVAPLVAGERGDIQFVFAGAGVEVSRRKNVVSLGFVDDIDALLDCANVALMPIDVGCGVRMKTFDYFRRKVPVVASAKALEGVGLTDGREVVFVQDSARDVIRGLYSVLDDDGFADRLSSSALAYLRQRHDPERLRSELLERIEAACAPRDSQSLQTDEVRYRDEGS